MTTSLAELERLFGPQFDLTAVSGGELTYFFSPTPGDPEIRHVRREGLPDLANQVRVLAPAYRPHSILPNLGPSTSVGHELVPPNVITPIEE